MKRVVLGFSVLLVSMAFAVSVTMASPKIMNHKHNGKKVHSAKKNAKRVNSCRYCHVGTGILKKKQGYLKGQAKFALLKSKPKCSGAGCH